MPHIFENIGHTSGSTGGARNPRGGGINPGGFTGGIPAFGGSNPYSPPMLGYDDLFPDPNAGSGGTGSGAGRPADPSVTSPTNPSPYNFDFSGNTISTYLSDGGVIDPSSYGIEGSINPIRSFLLSRGINVQGLTDEELAFLPGMERLQTAFDRMNTGVGIARTGLGYDLIGQQLSGQQNLFDMTGGMGLSSAGTGFGRRQAGITSGLRNLNRQYQTGLNQSMADFSSNILGMQYDFQDAESDFQDALTTALGNLGDEANITVGTLDDVNLAQQANFADPNNPDNFDTNYERNPNATRTNYRPNVAPGGQSADGTVFPSNPTQDNLVITTGNNLVYRYNPITNMYELQR